VRKYFSVAGKPEVEVGSIKGSELVVSGRDIELVGELTRLAEECGRLRQALCNMSHVAEALCKRVDTVISLVTNEPRPLAKSPSQSECLGIVVRPEEATRRRGQSPPACKSPILLTPVASPSQTPLSDNSASPVLVGGVL